MTLASTGMNKIVVTVHVVVANNRGEALMTESLDWLMPRLFRDQRTAVAGFLLLGQCGHCAEYESSRVCGTKHSV